MREYTTFQADKDAPVVRLTLNRPDVRNAFDEVLILELTDALGEIGRDESLRVMILTGKGSVFSAGADLNWMKKVVNYTYEENLEDAREFAKMMEMLYKLPIATIARVNGPCIGGGIGLISACDVAVSVDDAHFALREVLLGIAPAVISPYVLRKIGSSHARDYFLTGRRFDAVRASEIGLVNDVVGKDDLDAQVDRWVARFLRAGPNAIKATKELIDRVAWSSLEDAQDFTVETISRLRGSDEGQEGFTAFFEKRRPEWDPESERNEE